MKQTEDSPECRTVMIHLFQVHFEGINCQYQLVKTGLTNEPEDATLQLTSSVVCVRLQAFLSLILFVT